MSAERELLGRLQAALAEAQVDVDALVGQAWDQARREVQETLRRLMVRDLLERSLRALGRPGDAPVPAAPAGESAQASDADLDPAAAPAATYLYGFVRAGVPLPEGLPQLPGGDPVRTVDLGGLRALVCRLEQRTLDSLQAPGRDGLD
ncbi:MAG: hypothetical protein M3276_06070, partial [Actinomycetota bacterium]|nr:hypothetical protein [Actinomycetota bacterium]